MIAVCLSPLYLLLCAYVFYRLQTWLERCLPYLARKRIRIPIGIFYLCVAFSILAAFLLEPSPAKRLLKQFSNTWLGVLLYALLAIATADLIRLALKRLFLREESRQKLSGKSCQRLPAKPPLDRAAVLPGRPHGHRSGLHPLCLRLQPGGNRECGQNQGDGI